MTDIVIVAYRPKPGRGDALIALTHTHVPLLRRLGLATARTPIAMIGEGGVIVEAFEWASGAIARAHETPEVQALWARYAEIADYVALRDLPETGEMFATFAPLDPGDAPPPVRANGRDAAVRESELDDTL